MSTNPTPATTLSFSPADVLSRAPSSAMTFGDEEDADRTFDAGGQRGASEGREDEEREVMNAIRPTEEGPDNNNKAPSLSREAIEARALHDNTPEGRLYQSYAFAKDMNSDPLRDSVLWHATRKLTASDIVDRGRSPGRSEDERFLIKSRLALDTKAKVKALQSTLDGLIRLLPSRCEAPARQFRVLNHDHLDHERILNGTSSVPRLQLAWKLLCRRMEYGDRWVDKYYLECKQGPSVPKVSPWTTPSESGQRLTRLREDNNADVEAQLRANLENVPSYRGLDASWGSRTSDYYRHTPLHELVPEAIDPQLEGQYASPEEEREVPAHSFYEDGEREDLSYINKTSLNNPGFQLPEAPNRPSRRREANVTFAGSENRGGADSLSRPQSAVPVSQSISIALEKLKLRPPTSPSFDPPPAISMNPLLGMAQRGRPPNAPTAVTAMSALPPQHSYSTIVETQAMGAQVGSSGRALDPQSDPPNPDARRNDVSAPRLAGGGRGDPPDGDDGDDPSGYPRGNGLPPLPPARPRGNGEEAPPPIPPPALPNRTGPPGGNPGGGGGGNPGGGGGGNNGDLGGRHTDPYFGLPTQLVPKIRYEFDLKNIPQWDGSHGSAALQWFARVHQLASVRGYVPQQLGLILPFTFKPGSEIDSWYLNIVTEPWKEYMTSHYAAFLHAVRTYYLGPLWAQEQVALYQLQQFRQEGFKRETPTQFIQRRTLYSRLLNYTQEGSRAEALDLMSAAPPSWKTIVNLDTVDSVMTVHSRVQENEIQLSESVRSSSDNVASEVQKELCRLGYGLNQSSGGPSSSTTRRYPFTRQAHFAAAPHELPAFSGEEAESALSVLPPFGDSHVYLVEDGDVQTDPIIMEAYAVGKSRQRPPPKGGYPFNKRDDVKSPTKLPPSPCKCCGSSNHWDNDCPYWNLWKAKYQKTANVSELDDTGHDSVYYQAYDNLNALAALSPYDPFGKILPLNSSNSHRWGHHALVSRHLAQSFWLETIAELNEEVPSQKPSEFFSNRAAYPRATVEDAEDEDTLPQYPRLSASEAYLVDKVNTEPTRTQENFAASIDEFLVDAVQEFTDETQAYSTEKTAQEAFLSISEPGIAGPPAADSVEWIQPCRRAVAGQSSRGVSVLSVKGHVGSLQDNVVDLRLDSCADVSLLSEAYYQSLLNPPPLRQGMRMELYQLTNKDTRLKGYVHIPVWIPTSDGTVIAMNAEAYVVPGMTVPILLGEDFQQSYQVGISRDVSLGTTATFGPDQRAVTARAVERPPYGAWLRKSVSQVAAFVKAKTHRRNKAERARKKAAIKQDLVTVRAAQDLRIPANSSRAVKVSSYFDDPEKEWLVEKALLNNGTDEFFAVPNVLISAKTPFVPVANTSNHPRMIRQGDILGMLVDPEDQVERPRSEDHLREMRNVAARYAAIVEAFRSREAGTQKEQGHGAKEKSPSKESRRRRAFQVDPEGVAHPVRGDREPETAAADIKLSGGSSQRPDVSLSGSAVTTSDVPTKDSESWGPKTAEAPDNQVYSSKDLEKILDVGDLPEHLKPQAWEMLRKRIKVFGFDGRLGHLETKCHIRTKEGVQPISVPMYASSPAKRQVIDEQLQKWFEQEVIEPSKSPWSAPVVIIYRNGKPRFCVDYRKLNANTIPDEFPIPRQGEILNTLSGSQVLSSLDALSGFTQLEMASEDVEKTAFRTHRGLFQFKRMPFGLRNGPSIFQRVMQSILSPYLWLFCLVYIDDIVVYSRSYEEHIKHLDQVLGAIEEAGLTLLPPKCHLFYGSILLLGHKVSRLGLSTHREKVKAILEIERPKNLSKLQTFLGMVVYFSVFIPFYSTIAAPLFQLLRKGAKWHWGAEQEHAFQSAKLALQSAPILGHPLEGRPYRLYTDASDEALGCALQQVQPIRVGDMKNTRLYDRLAKLHRDGKPVPRLIPSMTDKILDVPDPGGWASQFDETVIHVERVVAYWSRTFKDAETRYSATEREALAAKEGLVRFQPFLEGESVILITDHAALQWAKTYENANKRLSAWGTVFSTYTPKLAIVHRPGRLHSNVDPLSRLPRAPPEHTSPVVDEYSSLVTDSETMEERELSATLAPAAKYSLHVQRLLEALQTTPSEVSREASAARRSARLRAKGAQEETYLPTQRNLQRPGVPVGDDGSPAGPTDMSAHSSEPLKPAEDPYKARMLWEETHR
ncbi:hypothetical protein EUX98_g1748 [Antrodiella citrinella]|uniref:Reverse transcriptase domain-containing protein n=1 Tax=Antrodiella citrinella TaxID=2447956 RepID=A0A4S4N3N3_9APHY|nr:hypothetical protein EUX98_g1748 [Antrodiella citrinella]